MEGPPRAANDRGLTLVELLVAVAVLGIVSASIPLLLNGGTRGLEVQREILDRELVHGRLFEEWRLDVAAATSASASATECVLVQPGGEVRYAVRAGGIHREMKRTGATAWTPRPMRALAVLEDGVEVEFTVNARSASLDVIGLDLPLGSVVAFRGSAP